MTSFCQKHAKCGWQKNHLRITMHSWALASSCIFHIRSTILTGQNWNYQVTLKRLRTISIFRLTSWDWSRPITARKLFSISGPRWRRLMNCYDWVGICNGKRNNYHRNGRQFIITSSSRIRNVYCESLTVWIIQMMFYQERQLMKTGIKSLMNPWLRNFTAMRSLVRFPGLKPTLRIHTNISWSTG